MAERDARLESFLKSAGWADALRAMLAGDASNRRYLRLIRPSTAERAVLMDAPPARGEDVRPFIRIAEYLCDLGLSAPRIYARDTENGFLLLEDLGDALFARVVERHVEMENTLYSTATDLLAELHCGVPPDHLQPYSPPLTAELAALAFDWYAPIDAATNIAELRRALIEEISAALDANAPECDVLIQRDYHAENLLWLPERSGIARVGLLDFQDAVLGHRAYDLVSLLQDARRDVPPEIEALMMARYIEASGQDAQGFTLAYATLGAQRNLRILGVFARLCLRDGKAHYVDLIPRVWSLLQRNLTHPALANLRSVCAALPLPNDTHLSKLKSKCATVPTL
ncbi:aminoglycoside phosphotransferase family protein [Roseovarius aestuariivivens]|uniref:aminoglycoside phosphotransferase family protein n=1 Tax=Roseovarius aestuariivivens TaxID=1888910 RepID=UPI0010810377|nr:phosphotransferase [Roseovarius aestuariivivens]